MDDLVKRLQSKTPNMAAGHKAMEEAANEITALCARLAEVEAALATARRDAAIARSFSCCHVPDAIAALIAQQQDKGVEG